MLQANIYTHVLGRTNMRILDVQAMFMHSYGGARPYMVAVEAKK